MNGLEMLLVAVIVIALGIVVVWAHSFWRLLKEERFKNEAMSEEVARLAIKLKEKHPVRELIDAQPSVRRRPPSDIDLAELKALVDQQETEAVPGMRKRMRVSWAYNQKHPGSSMRALSQAIDKIRAESHQWYDQ